MIGIYRITNNKNQKVYIGRSIDIERRIREHIHATIYCGCIDKAIATNGFEKFKYEILDTAKDKDQLSNMEKYWMRYYNSTEKQWGYNVATNGCWKSSEFSRQVINLIKEWENERFKNLIPEDIDDIMKAIGMIYEENTGEIFKWKNNNEFILNCIDEH